MTNTFDNVVVIILISAIIGSIFIIGKRFERKRFEQRIKDIREGKNKKNIHHDATIAWDSKKFVVETTKKEKRIAEMAWPEVAKATAYKRDLFSVDLICIFFAKADGTGIEVHEDSNGWVGFIEALPNFLPGCVASKSWWGKVALPAFLPNPTIIFERSNPLLGGVGC